MPSVCGRILLEQHGRKGIDAVLQPAIRAAEEGYVVAPRVAWDWERNREKLRNGTNTGAYLLSGGDAPTIGTVMRQPALAETLRIIATKGPQGFYSGAVAEDIIETLKIAGGLHTLDDFQNHRTEITQAISTRYRDHEIWQCPPNGPGVTMLMMLNVLGGFDLSQYPPLGVERFHLEAETSRHAFIARERHVGDPRFAAVDLATLLSAGFASEIRDQIHLNRVCALPPSASPMHPSTIYLCVVDRDRNVCSFVNSIAYAFGSAVVGARSGVLLQNRAAGFRIEPGHPNGIVPGKRPLHTLLAALVTRNGRAVLPFGVMGGQFQAVGQVHVLTNILDYGMDIQTALDLARGFHYEGVYRLEAGISATVMADLERWGHVVARSEEPLGGGQAIWIDWENGVLVGGSDPRKDGCALGY